MIELNYAKEIKKFCLTKVFGREKYNIYETWHLGVNGLNCVECVFDLYRINVYLLSTLEIQYSLTFPTRCRRICWRTFLQKKVWKENKAHYMIPHEYIERFIIINRISCCSHFFSLVHASCCVFRFIKSRDELGFLNFRTFLCNLLNDLYDCNA
jgi:hypothetical protein